MGGVRPPRRAWLSLGGVRARLLALVAAASIPVIGIATNNAWSAREALVAQGEREVRVLRAVAAARHGRAMDLMQETLTSLAREGEVLRLSPLACDAFLDRLRRLTPERYSNFWVLDARGDLLCSGLPATRGENFAHLDYFARVMETRAFFVADFTMGVLSRRPVLPALAPILDSDGQVVAMIGGSLYLEFFERGRDEARSVSAHNAWLFDRDGTPLPLGAADPAGLPGREDLDRLIGQDMAHMRGRARDGSVHAWASQAISPGLHLVVGRPMAGTLAEADSALRLRLLEVGFFLLACLAAIVIGAETGVARPLRGLAARVRDWSPGRPYIRQDAGFAPTEVRELDRALAKVGIALEERETELKAALRQRDLLMSEIHHRVKNNLQIVASLLSLQADRLRNDAARSAFAVARERVQALATLHRFLYLNQSFETVSLRPYLDELSRQLGRALGTDGRVMLDISADDVVLGADEAISLSLLVTEAVSNAMRHGFPDGRRGVIRVRLRMSDQEATLTIEDDGVGYGADGPEAADGIGMQLIEGFARHLSGSVETSSGARGTRIVVRFPVTGEARTADLAGAA